MKKRFCIVCDTKMIYWYTEESTGYEYFICPHCHNIFPFHPSEVQELNED